LQGLLFFLLNDFDLLPGLFFGLFYSFLGSFDLFLCLGPGFVNLLLRLSVSLLYLLFCLVFSLLYGSL
jgi:hypothetical protein